MVDIEPTEDWFRNENPLQFKPEAVRRLAEEHGIRPYWGNRRLRAGQTGWRNLSPVKFAKDQKTKAILDCLANPPLDPSLQTEDGFVVQGDLVLCVSDVREYQKRQFRRTWLANRKLKSIIKRSPVDDELAGIRRAEQSDVPSLQASGGSFSLKRAGRDATEEE